MASVITPRFAMGKIAAEAILKRLDGQESSKLLSLIIKLRRTNCLKNKVETEVNMQTQPCKSNHHHNLGYVKRARHQPSQLSLLPTVQGEL